MTPTMQTYFYGGNEDGVTRGNCWQACLASLLDLPLDDVPHFVDIDEQGGEDWWHSTVTWLWEKGFAMHVPDTHPENGYYLVTGKSPRGDFYHVVVYRNGELDHDPHPDGAGVLTEEHFVYIERYRNG